MTLDGVTLHIAIACAALFGAALLAVIYRLNPDEPAVAFWAAGNGFIGMGSLLTVLQNVEGLTYSYVPANFAVYTGMACLIYGLHLFYRIPARPLLLTAMIGVEYTVFVYFVFVEPLLWVRLVNSSAFMIALTVWPMIDLQRVRPTDTRSTAIACLMLGYGLQAITYTLRLLYAFEANPTGDYFASHAFLSNLALLQSLLTSFILNISFVLLVTERLHQRLRYLATIDELTGLFNRRAFNQMAELELARAARAGDWPALLIFDLDRFKSVNDRYGHQAGDEVLRQLSALVRTHIRTGDVVARMGGEEFAALLPATDVDRAAGVAERIRATMEDQKFVANGTSFRVTVSIGLTVFLPHETLHTAYLRADAALYAAKNGGRNRVVVSLPPDSSDDLAAAPATG